MGTPHWVSMFEDPRKYSDPSFVPDTCLSAIQESRCGEWVQGVRRVSKENLMSRPLPDIPKHSPLPSRHRNHSAVTSYDNKCYHEHPTEIQRSISVDDTKKRRRSKRNNECATQREKRKGDVNVRETSVTLTVSVKNSGKTHRHKDHCVGINNVSHSELSSVINTKSGTFDSYPRKESENSRTDLVRALPRKKRRRNACIVPMLVMTVLIVGGLFTAIAVIFLRPLEESDTEDKESGYKMVVATVQLRLLNQTFAPDMRDSSSRKYAEIEDPLCHEMDGMFLFSEYSRHYYGCKVQLLRSGSIHVLEELLFRETNELRKPSSIQDLIKSSSPSFDWRGLKVINVGDFVVDYDSIKVMIDLQKFPELPQKPFLSTKGISNEILHPTTNTPTSTKPILIRPKLWKWGKTTVATTTSRKSAAKPTTMTSAFVPQFKEKKLPTTTAQKVTRHHTEAEDYQTATPSTSTTDITSSTADYTSSLTSQPPEAKTSVTESMTPSTTKTETTTASGHFEEEGFSTTAYIPSTSDGPSIRMTNVGTPIAGGSVAIQCEHHNLLRWTYLTVTHVRKGFGQTKVLNVSSNGTADPPDRRYTDRLIVNLKLSETSASVSLNFTTIDCDDEGSYVCKVYSPGRTIKESGYLYVRATPTEPEVTMPLEIVDQREIEEPIKCRANVGYPIGILKWFVKPRGHSKYVELDVANVEFGGECKNIATSVFKLVPSLEGNGTVLKCSVINPHFSKTEELSTSIIWKVLPADMCRGKPDTYMARHPYHCDRYITCTNNTVHVHQCMNKLCFNTETNTCGQTGIVMDDVVAVMNEGVTSLTCRIQHMGSWNTINLWKILPSGDRVQIVSANNKTNVTIPNKAMQGRLFADIQNTKYESRLKLWIYTLECNDEGMYACEADIGHPLPEAKAKLSLKVKPKPPQIASPIEIIEGQRLRQKFICQGKVGFPNGALRWEVKYKGQTKFARVSMATFNDTKAKVKVENCSKTIRRELSFIPSKKQDEMMLRCVVENNETLPDGEVLWDSYKVHVISANYCRSRNTTYMTHPFNCRQYIQCAQGYVYVQQCSIGLCFNPDTEQCDIPEPTEPVVFDPEFPCRPNKNGVYYPHPFLCNKYMWCVQGKDILQHCPLGTLYLANGQCTFNTEQSLCYKKDEL